MNGIYILLGSNLGHRLNSLKRGAELSMKRGIRILDESSIYETEPWGNADQEWFLNVVLQVETGLSPMDLLAECLAIEKEMGRVREEKWGSRIIDIDILYYHDEILNENHLIVPHPGIPDRRFTLMPLVELCPNERHPITKQSQVELLASCTDKLDCVRTELHF